MRRKTDLLVVHCSASGPDSDIGVDEIDQWHRARTPPFDMIGYHAVIRRSGEIEFGRHFDEPGAHVQGHNYRSVGLCMVGGVDANGEPENNFTNEQFESLRALLDMLQLAYPNATVLGHRDLSPDLDGDGLVTEAEWLKDCPCFSVRDWL